MEYYLMATQYIMRAFKTTFPTGHVYWSSIGSPDFSGDQSGYNPLDLSSITIDYTTETPVNGNPITPVGLAGGDLSGTYPDPVVSKLQTNPISSTLPNNGDVLTWINADGYWEPQPPAIGGTQVLLSQKSYSLSDLQGMAGFSVSAIFPGFVEIGNIPNARLISCEIENTLFAAPGLSAATAQIVTAFPAGALTGFSDLMTFDGYAAPPPSFLRNSIGTPEVPQLQIILTGANFADLTSGSVAA
jgi:hypothetical protein